MDRAELQELQRPIKERYREDPERALVTLSADGHAGRPGRCLLGGHRDRRSSEAGLHPASGGDGALACSGDMLLEALVACSGVTLRSVATSLEIAGDRNVRAEGELDFRGTLGVDKEAPVGFRSIRLDVPARRATRRRSSSPRSSASPSATASCCQTLTGGVPVAVSMTSAGD